jgi:excisionase family DNA binding protein
MTTNTPGNTPIVLRIQPSADYISVSRAFLYQLIERGELVKIKLGGRAAGIRRSDLDAWVNAQAAR